MGDRGTMIMYKGHGNKSEVHEWRYYGHRMQRYGNKDTYSITVLHHCSAWGRAGGGGGRVGQG